MFKEKIPGILSDLAGFALQTAEQVKSALHDKALETAQKLDLAERSELETLRKRIAELEAKIIQKSE